MKKHFFMFLAAVSMVLTAAAEETRTIRLIQDDAQIKMATKMYELKHIKASDLSIFVEVAVRRYYQNSQVRGLNFSANKQQILIVTTAEKFIPYVDQIISTLDRGTTTDAFGSKIYGLGYKWKVYYPRYRNVIDLITPADVMLSGTGNVFAFNGTLWLKDDIDDIDYALDWIKYFDRPVPQANVTFRYYTIRESNLRDLGIDYLAWKNGPGMNLLDVAYNSGRVDWGKIFETATNLASVASWSYGGCFTAPAFDMSFIRMLQQSGEAKIAATGSLVVTSGQSTNSSISLTPGYNNILKDTENHKSSLALSSVATDFNVTIYGYVEEQGEFLLTPPTICFFTEPKEVNEYGWIPTTPEFYAKNKGSLSFAYKVTSNDAVESNNYGQQLAKTFSADATMKTIHFGREQVLAQVVREEDIEQTTGVPFLCRLPVFKYIFGTTTTIKEKVYCFVTAEANLLHPEAGSKK